MPELPEVETTVNELKRKVLHRTFLDIWSDAKNLIKKPRSFEEFKKEIIGRKIKNIKRKGKNILIELDEDKTLLVHQKLTGHLLVGRWKKEGNKWVPLIKGPLEDPANRFLHLIFWLDNNLMLALSDLRKFAKVELWESEKLREAKEFKEIGIDPLSKKFSFEEFKRRIKKTNKKIKQTLMDQNIIAGIGNIYSDEILFKARVHPLRKVKNLSEEELRKIYQAIKDILKKAIKVGGESISDYRKPNGSKGGFDRFRKVYRREGEKCFRCGTTIKRIKIGGRSSYFCPSCQK
jgi:formamidopyrimidine-DNA glycosylase